MAAGSGWLTDLLSREGDGDIMGWRSGQVWPSCQGPLHPEQKTARQVGHGTAAGRPSVLGCRLHTAWHSSTGHQALLGSNFTPAESMFCYILNPSNTSNTICVSSICTISNTTDLTWRKLKKSCFACWNTKQFDKYFSPQSTENCANKSCNFSN